MGKYKDLTGEVFGRLTVGRIVRGKYPNGRTSLRGTQMNYIKWLICWWNKTHIYAHYTDKNGHKCYRCIRCGIES